MLSAVFRRCSEDRSIEHGTRRPEGWKMQSAVVEAVGLQYGGKQAKQSAVMVVERQKWL